MIEFFKEPNLLRLREEILPIISLVVTVGIGENSLLVLVKIHSFLIRCFQIDVDKQQK